MKKNNYIASILFCLLTAYASSLVAQPSGLSRGFASNITSYSADINFPGYDNPPSHVSNWSWYIEYGVEDKDKFSYIKEGKEIRVNNVGTFITLTDLIPNRYYVVKVIMSYMSNGGNLGQYSIRFKTPQVPATLPYRAYLDDSNQWDYNWMNNNPLNWEMRNGTLRTIYDTNYQPNPFQYYMATTYRAFDFSETGKFRIDFNWKFYKTNYQNFFRVFLVPEDRYINSISRYPDNEISFDTDILNYSYMNDNSWQKQSVEFTISKAGKYNLYIYYEGSSGDNYTPFADMNIPVEIGDIYIRKNCQTPVSLSVSDITDENGMAMWQEKGEAVGWNVKLESLDKQYWYIRYVDELLIILSGLLPSTTYEVSVQANCGDGNHSNWSNKSTFTTLTAFNTSVSDVENDDSAYSYRYFLWNGSESPTKPIGVNFIRVTFYKNNPVAYDKYIMTK